MSGAGLRYSLRSLAQHRIFTIVAALTLALGIGANTAIFSVVNAVLLHPLPYAKPGRVIIAWEKRRTEGTKTNGVAPADYLDWRARSGSFSSLTALDQSSPTLTGDGPPQVVVAVTATSSLLSTFGVQPIPGRGFSPAGEEAPPREALLSYGFWQSRFGADARAVGRTLWLDGEPYKIIGVLPLSFYIPFGKKTDLYVPLKMSPTYAQDRGSHDLLVVGRLRPGIALSTAQAELDTISASLEKAWPKENTGHAASLVPIGDQVTEEIRPVLLILSATVLFVLLIACANVANLFLARASARAREIAVRQALGATRASLIRLLLTESLLVSVIGSAAGIALAAIGVRLARPLLPHVLGISTIPGIDSVSIDARVLGFALLLAPLTALIFGLAPALQLSRTDLRGALGAWGRSHSGGLETRRLRGLLITAETALACVLLAGAALLVSSFLRLIRVQPGFQTANRLSLQIPTPERYRSPARQRAFYSELLRQVSALPSVRSAALTNYVPGRTWGWRWGLRIEGQPKPRNIEEMLKIHMRLVSDTFLSTMGIPLLRGRAMSPQDSENASPVVWISQETARRYFPGQDPIGKRIAFGDQVVWRTIAGVTGSVKHRGLDKDPDPEIYAPLAQVPNPSPQIWMVIQAMEDPVSLSRAIQAQVSALDSTLPVSDITTIDQLVAESTAGPRFHAVLGGSFAGLAFLLAMAGLYGVMGYLVAQQTREIGVRIALGAQRSQVFEFVFRQAAMFVLPGIALGVAASVAAARLLRAYLFGVSPADPRMYIAVAMSLLAVAAAATFLPARRASRIDPIAALRAD